MAGERARREREFSGGSPSGGGWPRRTTHGRRPVTAQGLHLTILHREIGDEGQTVSGGYPQSNV